MNVISKVILFLLQHIVEFISHISVSIIIVHSRVGWYHGMFRADIYCIVHFPVNVSYFSRRMEQPLQDNKPVSPNK